MRPTTPATLARAALVMLLATLGMLAVGVGPAAARDDVGWTVATADNSFGSGRPNYTYTLNPGGSVSDALIMANHGATPLDLAVYAADGFTSESGQLDLRTKDIPSAGVGAWVYADRASVTVQPGQSVEVPFTLTLPDSAAPGDYLGGIVTSQTSQNVERRVGLRIRLRVGGPLTPSLAIEDLRVEYSGTANPFGTGSATVTYTIRNSGNAIVGARQAVSVSGPFFHVSPEAVDDTPQLLPGDTWRVTVPVRGVTPAFRLTCTVSLTPLLTDASGSVAPLALVETTTGAWAVPWTLVVVFLGLGVGLLFVIRMVVRRRALRGAGVRVGKASESELRERGTADR